MLTHVSALQTMNSIACHCKLFVCAGPMPLQSFKSYKNDLFGDEEGDVLAGETIPAARPIEVTAPRPTTPSGRVQQQIALNQQKRLARLQVTAKLQLLQQCSYMLKPA